MKLSLNRGTCRWQNFVEFVDTAALAGFDAADVDMEYAAEAGSGSLLDLYQDHNLSYGGWGPRFDWRKGESAFVDGLAAFGHQVKVAADLGIDTCATWVMPSSEMPFLENWHFHIKRLCPIAKVLGAHGLRLGLEFVAPYHLRRKFAHEFVFTLGLMLELASEVGQNVGLLVDSFHLQAAGEPTDRISNIPAEKIVLVHINDSPKIDGHQLIDDQRLLPGEGGTDLPQFIAQLQRAGYSGVVSAEVFNSELKELDPLPAARLVYDSCRRFLPAQRLAAP